MSVSLKRWLPLVVFGALIVGALIIGSRPSDSAPQTTEERATAIAERVKCPTCRNLSVADSKAGLSRVIYQEIVRRVEAGQSDQQILQFMRESYGDEELLVPPATGAGSVVWIAPVVLLIGGAGVLGFAFRRWSRSSTAVSATDADRALVARARRRAGESPMEEGRS
jgi:cytochrome c-type biogenesis protein CcmH